MYRLSGSAFCQIVYSADDKCFIAVFFDVQQAFVRVYHLFEVGVSAADDRKRGLVVEGPVYIAQFGFRKWAVGVSGCQYPAGEVASDGDEVQWGAQAGLELLQAAADFFEVLVPDCLLHLQVFASPTEVAGLGKALSITGLAGDSLSF